MTIGAGVRVGREVGCRVAAATVVGLGTASTACGPRAYWAASNTRPTATSATMSSASARRATVFFCPPVGEEAIK